MLGGERSLLIAPVIQTLDEVQDELLTSHWQPLSTCSNNQTSFKRRCDCEQLGSVLNLKEKIQEPFVSLLVTFKSGWYRVTQGETNISQ